MGRRGDRDECMNVVDQSICLATLWQKLYALPVPFAKTVFQSMILGGPKKMPKTVQKKAPKMNPNWTPKGTQRAPNGVKNGVSKRVSKWGPDGEGQK